MNLQSNPAQEACIPVCDIIRTDGEGDWYNDWLTCMRDCQANYTPAQN